MNARTLAVHLVILAASSTSSAFAADLDPDVRVTRSASGFSSARGEARVRDPATLVESETLRRERTSSAKGSDASVLAFTNGEAWVYDATAELFDDFDGDGYYTYIRVRFDVDSLYLDHWVYARLFISEDGVTWDEYHVTDDFLVDGSTSFDDYEVETELVSGFPTGLYDVLIEIYDADFGDFLADFGPADTSALSLLPLEEVGLDPSPPILVTDGGGGALDWPTVLGLVLALLAAARLRRAPMLSVVGSRAPTASRPSERSETRRRRRS